jgi:hypothetical protein
MGSHSASAEVDVQPAENELAVAHRDRSLFATDALAAQFLATLRGRLEQDLIMLRASDLDTSGNGIAPYRCADRTPGPAT